MTITPHHAAAGGKRSQAQRDNLLTQAVVADSTSCASAVAEALIAGVFDERSVIAHLHVALQCLVGAPKWEALFMGILLRMPLAEGQQVQDGWQMPESGGNLYRWVRSAPALACCNEVAVPHLGCSPSL